MCSAVLMSTLELSGAETCRQGELCVSRDECQWLLLSVPKVGPQTPISKQTHKVQMKLGILDCTVPGIKSVSVNDTYSSYSHLQLHSSLIQTHSVALALSWVAFIQALYVCFYSLVLIDG